MATTDFPGGESVYQGSSIAPIRQVAEALGATVDWDPTSAIVKVNGKTIPYDQIRDGHSYGNLGLIAAAAGGKVQQNQDGTYSVYRAPTPNVATPSAAASTPGSSTPVTGGPATAAFSPVMTGAGLASGLTNGPGTPVAQDGTIEAAAPAKKVPSASGPQVQPGGTLTPQEAQPAIQPFTYQETPIDYAALQTRAAQEASMWAQPQLQALRDLATRYQQDATNQAGYIRQGLQDDVDNLRAGEAVREGRINEDMNRRGDAIYNSGVRFGAVRDQQINTFNQEVKLTARAQNALQKLSDSLGVKLADLAAKERNLGTQQGNKAMLTLQQLADKAQTQAFDNKKATWQMWLQGSRLTLDQQTQANELWLNVQRIKSADDRAAAERDLKAAIASGQLDLQYAKLAQEADQFTQKQGLEQQKLTLQQAEAMSKQTGFIYGLDGKPILDGEGNMVPNLDRAKFDWDQKKFVISEQDKVDYQNELIRLKEQGLINDAAYKSAQQEIQRGQLSLENAKLLETTRHNQATEANAGADSKVWSGAKSELDKLLNPQYGMTQEEITLGMGQLTPDRAQTIQSQRVAAARAIVSRYYSYMSDQDKQALTAYLKANGLM